MKKMKRSTDKRCGGHTLGYRKYKDLDCSDYREYQSKVAKYRYHNDINVRIKQTLRSRLYISLKKGYKKPGSAVKNLGCSIDEFKEYIREKFTEGMSWDNYGGWHLDHIIPLKAFDLTNKDELKKACHYSNLQPLWAIENLKKSAKILKPGIL